MAKIPTILEAGRADGKLATSNSLFDENKGMFQSELNDIQDTLNSDNPNKPLSANQGKILKELLDSKVIEAGAIPIDEEPIEGNTTHIISSDAVYKNSQADKIRHLSSILGTKTVKDNLDILENIIGINLIWEEGYYLNPSGYKIAHTNWKITDYIPLNNILYNIAYKVQLFKNTAICLYNSNKMFITSYYPNSDTVITIKDIIDISQHPEAAYIRFTTAILDNTSFAYKILGTGIIANESITKNKLAKDAIVNITKNEKITSIKIGTNDVINVLNGEYAEQIDSLSSEVINNTKNITKISNDILTVNQNLNLVSSNISRKYNIYQGYINSDGDVIDNNTFYNTDYIPIKLNQSLIYNNTIRSIDAGIYICFYDKDKNKVLSYSQASDGFGIKTRTITNPKIKYVRLSFYISSIHLFFVYIDNDPIIQSINEKFSSINSINYTWLSTNGYITRNGNFFPFESSWVSTDYIEINTSPVINNIICDTYISKDTAICLYDSNKKFIKYYSNDSDSVKHEIITIDLQNQPNAKYIRCCTIEPDLFNLYKNLQQSYIKNLSGKDILDKSISLKNLSFAKHDDNTNYINHDTLVPDTYINSGIETKYNGFYSTGPVYLKQNIDYYWKYLYIGYYAFYAEDGTILEYHNINDPIPNPFRLCEGATYARFTIVDPSSKDKSWIFTSNNQPNPYKEIIDKAVIPIDIKEKTFCDYDGNEISAFAKCVCIGDSLTEGTMNYKREGQSDGYISYDKCSFPRNLERLTGITVSNLGIGGATSFEWYKTNRNKPFFVVPEEGRVEDYVFDMAIIQMGVNDAIRNMSRFGKAWSTPEDTAELEDPTANSYDGFMNIINKLKTECKHIKIFISTIIPTKSYSSPQYIEICQNIRDFVTELNDPDVILIDIQTLGHTKDYDAYNCGHLSAFGYWRLAQDYKNVISYYMNTHKNEFRTIQFVGTDYTY